MPGHGPHASAPMSGARVLRILAFIICYGKYTIKVRTRSGKTIPILRDQRILLSYRPMKRFLTSTLGCKVNQAETSAAEELLRRRGWLPAQTTHHADLVIVNSCCVTITAARKSRQAIRRMIRSAPKASYLFMGCLPTARPDEIRQIVDSMDIPPQRVLLTGHHEHVLDRMETFLDQLERPESSPNHWTPQPAGGSGNSAAPLKHRYRQAFVNKVDGTSSLPAPTHHPGHQRAFVKAQDGCDAFCRYCIVPFLRPIPRSVPADVLQQQCRALVANGYREIVLCGVFLGAYGRTTANRRRWPATPSPLPDLLRCLARTEGLWRLRLSSLEPGDVTEELLDFMASTPTIAPHLHLPLQSGSSRVLRRMNRQYNAEEFLEVARLVRQRLDRPAITTDIIVGHPGEEDADFHETLRIAQSVAFSKIHAFPFSAVPPTASWKHRREAPAKDIVRKRLEQLRELEGSLSQAYRQQLLGIPQEGLVESGGDAQGHMRAMSERYVPLEFTAPASVPSDDLVGEIHRFIPTGLTQDGIQARLAE